jgi:hypothetical protein
MSINSNPPEPVSRAGSDLPLAILSYIAAANDGNVDDGAACFAEDARVHDENRDHQGLDAVREWIAETTEASKPRNEVLSATSDGETHHVTSRISGDFPGSPVELTFDFTLSTNGKISRLAIQ